MNQKFQEILTLSIWHTYFEKNECKILFISPINDTKRKMKQMDFLINSESNVFSLYSAYDADEGFSWKSLINVVDELYFFVLNSDNNFLNYTDIPLVIDDDTYYFTTKKGSEDVQKKKNVSSADRVSLTDLQFNIPVPKKKSVNIKVNDSYGLTLINQTLDGTIQTTFIVDLTVFGSGYYELYIDGKLQQPFLAISDGIPNNCFGVLRVDLKAITKDQSKTLPVNYTLDFKARSTFWQYQVVIAPNKKIDVISMSIKNKQGYTYSGPVLEPIVGGNTANVFISTKTIPLQQSYQDKQILKVVYRNEFSTRKIEMDVPLSFPDVTSIQELKSKKSLSYVSNKIVYV